jgi:hypothetical protein
LRLFFSFQEDDAGDDPDKAGAREDLCRFLAACYYEPGPDFAEERVFDTMLDAARRIDPELAELAQVRALRRLQTLLVDTRLFSERWNWPATSFWLSRDHLLHSTTATCSARRLSDEESRR